MSTIATEGQPTEQQQQSPQEGGSQPVQQGGEGQSFNFRNVIGDDGHFTADWTKSLPESHKGYAATLQKFPTPLAMAASYGELEKKIRERSQPLAPPLPGDPPEKVEAFTAELRKLTGAPDKPEGYEIKAPEKMPEGIKWDEEGAGKLAAIAHKHAIPKAAVADILALQQERMGLMAEGAKGTMEQRMAAGKAELQGEWKDNFKSNVEAAVKAAKMLGVDMTDPELGNSPKVIKAMYNASLLMREDTIVGGGNSSTKTKEEQINEIVKSDSFNGKNGAALQREAMDRLKLISGHKAA